MKNKYISPVQIPHLVRLTADLFNTLDKEVQAMHTSPQKAIQVNFVVDLLRDFVDIAYPIDAKISNNSGISKEQITNSNNLYNSTNEGRIINIKSFDLSEITSTKIIQDMKEKETQDEN